MNIGEVLRQTAGSIAAHKLRSLLTMLAPMPLYSEMYKTAHHEGDIFLKTSGSVMLTAFLILAFVGATAGMWPALKAARMEPVEALRYE